ncbi:cob(I)yrinic acid a,c-diamide adenosyltransferase [Candidatus Thorarchaeota archaeon]|nr:MAG: cob(I)yrinic acid a,c-diamide adenosyltransferase [Candidatus Thorarchaeota archaeon]
MEGDNLSKRVYTRSGDKGKTGLLSGDRLDKDDPRVEAYGSIDELTSMLGVAKVYASERIAEYLHQIQQTLFYISSELAVNPETVDADDPIMKKMRRVHTDDVIAIEKITDDIAESLPYLKNFVIPGGTKAAAFLHLSRTICRRVERRFVSFSKEYPVNDEILRYLNRLSDLLFEFARYENIEEGDGDQIISHEGTFTMKKE